MSAQVWLLAVLSSVPAASGSMESGYGLRAAVVEALEAAARSGNSMGLPVGPVFCATLTDADRVHRRVGRGVAGAVARPSARGADVRGGGN